MRTTRAAASVSLSLSVALAAVACGTSETAAGPTAVRAADFDQSCAAASDCVLVAEGECAPSCVNTGINAREAARWNAAVEKVRANDACKRDDAARCAPAKPSECFEGKCRVNPSPPTILASDFDRRCATPDDCTLIVEYRGDCAAGCAFAPIAKSDLARWEEARKVYAGCPSSASTKSSCPAVPVVCTAGQCTACAPGDVCPSDAGAD
jgi:hypothetical protein